MRNLKQFILCNGKIPVHPEGYKIDAHNPVNHMSWDAVKIAANAVNYSIGFVFISADPYWFLDIDHAREGDKWSELAVSLCNAFPGAHIEVSQSGEGLHIFGSG